MAKKSKRRTKQAKRRSEKRAQGELEVSAGERLLRRIQREAQARRDRQAYLLRQEEEKAWRLAQLRRARGLDDLDLDDPEFEELDLDDLLDDLGLYDLLDDWDDES